MTLMFKRGLGDSVNQLVPPRTAPNGRMLPTPEQSMRHSAVFACLNLRASLIASMPVSQYRMQGGMKAPMPLSPLLTRPGALHLGGPIARFDEWMYATQMDLDRYGNTFGMKVAWDGGWGIATRIDLLPADQVTVKVKDGEVTYGFAGKTYTSKDIWHERQYVIAGSPVGLSPMALAAYVIGQYTSALEFAAQWFSSGGIPSAALMTGATLKDEEAQAVKNRVKNMMASGDLLVLGKGQEYKMITVPANQAAFIEAMDYSVLDVARIFGTPGNMIDVAVQGSSITYANVTQKNLDYLITRLAPVIARRESAISAALPEPHLMEFDTDALLRLDPQTMTLVRSQQVNSRALTPDEWRQMDNREPLTTEQEDQFMRLFAKYTDKIDGSSDVLA